jgi:hypothetical protein
MVEGIELLFPALQNSGYRITSPASRDYNCIAWAAGDDLRWWWPDPDPDNDAVYWPAGVVREETLAAFVAAYATLGYVPCANEELEAGFEKMALFAQPAGAPTHAARQLPTGRWTSKLGLLEDIDHSLHDLAGERYGAVAQILIRPTLNP